MLSCRHHAGGRGDGGFARSIPEPPQAAGVCPRPRFRMPEGAPVTNHTDPANAPPPSLDRFAALWRRINDHKLVQWSIAYIAAAYAIQHAVILTGESFEWPNIVARASMLLLILGLPLVMTLAWYHGAKASRRVSG